MNLQVTSFLPLILQLQLFRKAVHNYYIRVLYATFMLQKFYMFSLLASLGNFTFRGIMCTHAILEQKFCVNHAILNSLARDLQDAHVLSPQGRSSLHNGSVLYRSAILSKKKKTESYVFLSYVSWIGHILRRNCLLHDAIEAQMTEVKGVGKRRTQLLDDLRNRRY